MTLHVIRVVKTLSAAHVSRHCADGRHVYIALAITRSQTCGLGSFVALGSRGLELGYDAF